MGPVLRSSWGSQYIGRMLLRPQAGGTFSRLGAATEGPRVHLVQRRDAKGADLHQDLVGLVRAMGLERNAQNAAGDDFFAIVGALQHLRIRQLGPRHHGPDVGNPDPPAVLSGARVGQHRRTLSQRTGRHRLYPAKTYRWLRLGQGSLLVRQAGRALPEVAGPSSPGTG